MVLARLVSDNKKFKKPCKSKNNIFTIYSPKNASIDKADTISLDTELVIKLPENTHAVLATKFEGQKIQKIIGPKKERLWITLLNESYFDTYKIKEGDVIGYLVVEPEDLKIHYETKEKHPAWKKSHPSNYLPKDWQTNWKKYWQKKKADVSSSDRRFLKSL